MTETEIQHNAVFSINYYTLPKSESRLIGKIQYHTVKQGEFLQLVADQYNVGFLALLEANPNVDPFLLIAGDRLIIPTQTLLPDAPREGIVINLAELRLYYFDLKQQRVYVAPVGIGRVGRETPEMSVTISQKKRNPTWTPTVETRKEYLAKGVELPQIVPAGENNPLGLFALRLAYGNGEYLIHGTNKDFGIGLRVSAGCIRLRPDNIEWLFSQVEQGDKVTIINQPIKRAIEADGSKWLEVHSGLSTNERDSDQQSRLELDDNVVNFISTGDVNRQLVDSLLNTKSGLPTKITASLEEISRELF
ncbi:L,D-transpeptidase family protein [Vibrio sp. SS-MA-C1-2]|uniref:L,D-transpeptidase family protein n=1 Tax=Vibrio sp. SS-MA-C1-2 TaxID=2908646 RepID=UPI001F0298A4|nr:L,D-transpeptidase family protein [Vibrio sp. SS-MA-C1-2]UJF17399.1 L,D-transpeptidase family protein [Vibrio sp. SS-MA-C1-2]